MINNSNIKYASLISYGVIVFNIMAGIFYTPWMVSQIGRQDYGLYILVTTFLAYFVVDYGMWQSLNMLISKYRAEGRTKKIEQIIGVATKIYLFIDIILCVVLCIVYYFIESIFSNLPASELIKFKNIFLIAAVFSILNFPFNFIRGIMFAYEYLVQNYYFELASKVSLILATITVLILGGGLYWLVLVYAFVPLVKNIAIVLFLYKQGVRMDVKFWSKEAAMSILGISVWLFMYVLAELFINNISPTIIALRSTLDQVAVFAIGLTLYGYVYQISNAVAGLFLPKITRMRNLEQRKEIEEYAIKISRIQLIINGFVIFGIIVSGSYFINAWMGKAFAGSYFVASIMIIPGLIIFSQQVEQSYLFASGMIRYRTILIITAAISSVTISFLLTPKYGAVGAAIGIASSNLIFMAVGMSLVYYRLLKFDIRKFYLMFWKFLSVFIVVALCVLLLDRFIVETYFFFSNKWVKFILIGSFYTILYCISIYFLLLNNYEKGLIQNIYSETINKIKKR